MRVVVVRGGGIAGLVMTTSADSDALSPQDAEALRAKVEESGLFDLPDRLSGPTAQPDAFDYEVTVDDGARIKRVTLTEDVVPPGVRALITWLESVPGHQESIGPPGGP